MALGVAACGSRTGSLVDDRGATGSGDGGTMTEPDAPPTFPTGVYHCSSSLNATGTYEGIHYESVSGGDGTLTVTQSGPWVTTAYTGDQFVSGTLRFEVTTDDSAAPAGPGQPLSFLCFTPFAQPQGAQQSLSVASGSLTMDGKTLFLSFRGTAEPGGGGASPCDGVTIPGTLVCTSR
jgi:hypothetical protein